jgi:hypothetical protein
MQTSRNLAASLALGVVLTGALSACGGGLGQTDATTSAAADASRAHAAAVSTSADTPTAANACPAGAALTALTPDAGWARDGSVFSATLYDPSITSGNTTHQPRKLKVRVTLNGQPVSGCAVNWHPQDSGNPGLDKNGWAFPDAPATDFNGISSAWWTAGSTSNQTLEVSLLRADGSSASVQITGASRAHKTRANSIHVSWSTPAWQKFSAEVTPHSWPATTYYEVIGFNNGYGGIQSNQLLFSLWDLNGVSPVVIDPGISVCTNFGGEGTGIKCEAAYTPQTDVTYRFELEVAPTADGRQDYSMYFTDPRDGQRKKLGTLRLPRPLPQSGAYGFVEDWADMATSCLENPVRAATFGNVRFQDLSGQWVDVKKASGDAVYTPDHNEVCANYRFDLVGDGQFRISTGGHDVGHPLNLPGVARTVPMPYVAPVAPPPLVPGLNVVGSQGALGSALDIPAAATTPGTLVEIYPTHGGASQQWTVAETAAGSGLYTLINPHSGLALSVVGSSVAPGARVSIEVPDGTAAQQWRVVSVRSGVYALIHAASGLALDTQGGGISALTPVIVATPESSPTQEWAFASLP